MAERVEHVTLLLGAEGYTETKDLGGWIRDATEDEADVFWEQYRGKVRSPDHNGRLYRLVTVTKDAPPMIWEHAQRVIQTVRLGE